MNNQETLVTLFPFIFSVLLIWSFIWKGMALWLAARKSHKAWFVILLIVNTLGILEILYIYIFSKKTPVVVATPAVAPITTPVSAPATPTATIAPEEKKD